MDDLTGLDTGVDWIETKTKTKKKLKGKEKNANLFCCCCCCLKRMFLTVLAPIYYMIRSLLQIFIYYMLQIK